MGALEILEEMRYIIHIPYFEQLFFHKLKELKCYFDEEVAYLTASRRKFKRSVYKAMEICDETDEDQDETSQSYFFEAMRTEAGKWQATVEPLPPPGYDIHDILPEDIITHMSTFQVANRATIPIADYTLPHLKGTLFDLEFIKYSEGYILGAITPHPPVSKHKDVQLAPIPPEPPAKIYQYDPSSHSDETNFKELLYYMKTYPALKAYFATELQMKIKPLIHGNLVDLTANSQPLGQS